MPGAQRRQAAVQREAVHKGDLHDVGEPEHAVHQPHGDHMGVTEDRFAGAADTGGGVGAGGHGPLRVAQKQQHQGGHQGAAGGEAQPHMAPAVAGVRLGERRHQRAGQQHAGAHAAVGEADHRAAPLRVGVGEQRNQRRVAEGGAHAEHHHQCQQHPVVAGLAETDKAQRHQHQPQQHRLLAAETGGEHPGHHHQQQIAQRGGGAQVGGLGIAQPQAVAHGRQHQAVAQAREHQHHHGAHGTGGDHQDKGGTLLEKTHGDPQGR